MVTPGHPNLTAASETATSITFYPGMQTQNQMKTLIVSLEVILQTQMFLLALLVQDSDLHSE